MNCLVCNGSLSPHFSKDFAGAFGLGEVNYLRCGTCGAAISETHYEMDDCEWAELNFAFHAVAQDTGWAIYDPRWEARLRAQYENMTRLAAEELLPRHKPWIDYACGDGKLADMLSRAGLPTLKYEKYLARGREGYVGDDALTKPYSVVINTSVFEHVRSIEPLDEVAGLVGDDGVLALHTLVREEIPSDPDWFYLLPVHATFFTNRSMQILFDRWGFLNSIYHVPSRMWFAYRRVVPQVSTFMERQPVAADEFHFKQGFMDYWK